MRQLFFVVLLAACSPATNKCADKTLFVSLVLEGSAKDADHILVEVSVDGGTAVPTTLAHQPGTAMGGVQIEFPRGYPKGKSVRVDVTATSSGNVIASASVTLTLNGACQATPLTVTGVPEDDLAGVRIDLNGADLSPLPGVDFAGVDLGGADLGPCTPVAESCFNGVDDDCDGLADCADPDCTGGGSPIAACVLDPSMPVGVTLSGAVTCPAVYPSPVPLGSNFSAGNCGMGTCACSPTMIDDCCVGQLTSYGADNTCMSSPNVLAVPYSFQNGGCANVVANDGDHHVLSPPIWSFNGSTPCSNPTGMPLTNPAVFNAHDTFCGGGTVGVGCQAGSKCVPAAINHCVIQPGDQVPCPSGYTKRPTHYFTGLDDPLTCTCSCQRSSDGSCAGVDLTFYSGSDCTGVATITAPYTCSNQAVGYAALKVGTPSTAGQCSMAVTTGGAPAAPTGEQTICCLP